MNSNITKRKRLLSILTALMLVLAMAAAVPPREVWATADVGTTFIVDNITYTITNADTNTVSVKTAATSITEAVLAETVEHQNVKYTVTAIEGGAFRNRISLTTLTIPGSVTSIGNSAFSYCSQLNSVTIQNGLETIGDNAFHSCTSLTTLTIPKSVISIAPDAFYRCSSLTAIHVNEGNTAYMDADGILFDKSRTRLVRYPAGKTASEYAVPDNVRSIGDYAFEYCINLTAVTMPDSVASIGNRGFESCKGLASIGLPGSIQSIGDYAFSNCESLTSIAIPQGITSIEDYAFYGCIGLTSIGLPGSVTSIGEFAFNGCTHLASIALPNSVQSIGSNAFRNIPADANVLVVFNEAPDANKEIRTEITHAITNKKTNWYRGFRTFNTAADPVVLTLEQNKEYDLNKILGITDTVYKGEKGETTAPDANISIPFILSGSSSANTKITGSLLKTGADETGPLTIDAYGKTIMITKEGPYIPPAVYYTLTAADLAFPDLAQGDAPSPLPLSISCTGNSGTSITRVVLDSTDFILDDSAAETYVGAGKTNDTYLIIPREGLAPGTYQADLTITYGYGRTVTAKVSLTVTKASQAAPTGLKASSKSYRSTALSWKAADRAEKYQVYRAASKDGKYKLLYTTAKTETTNTGLTCGKKYYYKMRAYRTVTGKKVYSKFTAPKAVTVRPSAPSFNLKADMGKMTVTWKGVSGASGYRIYRASSKNGKYTLIRDSASKARTYTSTGLKSGRTYYYKLRAYRMVNGKKVYSAYSAIQKKTVK